MNAPALPDFQDSDDISFVLIAESLVEKGFCILPNALPHDLSTALAEHALSMSADQYHRAGIGRAHQHMTNRFVRSDEVCWIEGESEAGEQWLAWTEKLRIYLNRRLFLGLFSFESHFAHYPPGAFYKTHVDAFKGQSNRILTVVAYLNSGWMPDDGGEMVLYTDTESFNVTPALGTLAIFLSEEFPHEVLPTQRDRYSIAGWYRLNTSIGDQIDPPN